MRTDGKMSRLSERERTKGRLTHFYRHTKQFAPVIASGTMDFPWMPRELLGKEHESMPD